MGELIQIGDILIRSNNTSSSIDSDFAKTHCAKMDCHACCKEMTIAMTVAEFIAYKENSEQKGHSIAFTPVPCQPSQNPRNQLIQTSNVRRQLGGDTLRIYYQTVQSHKPGNKGKPVELDELKPQSKIWVLVDGDCPNLVKDAATNAKKCSIFGKPERPSACSGLQALTPECLTEMRLKRVLSQVEQ